MYMSHKCQHLISLQAKGNVLVIAEIQMNDIIYVFLVSASSSQWLPALSGFPWTQPWTKHFSLI